MRIVLLILLACVRTRPPEVAPPDLDSFSAPADARAWYLRARYAEAIGDPLEAERAMDWALRLDRGNPWAQLAAARFYEGRGDLPRARIHACAALARAPAFEEAHTLVARVAADEGCGAR